MDGRSLSFQSANVETGTWDLNTATFTSGGGSPNAVRVTARYTVPNAFAAALGVPSTPVACPAVAMLNVTGYGLVGLNYVKLSGNSTASYWSAGGPAVSNKGNVGSNGSVTTSGSSTIHGDVYHGPGKTVSGSVTGQSITLSSPLSFTTATASQASQLAGNNDDANVPSWALTGSDLKIGSNKNLVLPGGFYYFNNVDVSGTASITFTGPALLYAYGHVNMSGNTTTYNNTPGNLTIVTGVDSAGNLPGPVTISGNSSLYATVYAPQSAVTVSGTGSIYGSVLGLSIDMSGTADVYYDMSLNANNGTVSLVQ